MVIERVESRWLCKELAAGESSCCFCRPGDLRDDIRRVIVERNAFRALLALDPRFLTQLICLTVFVDDGVSGPYELQCRCRPGSGSPLAQDKCHISLLGSVIARSLAAANHMMVVMLLVWGLRLGFHHSCKSICLC